MARSGIFVRPDGRDELLGVDAADTLNRHCRTVERQECSPSTGAMSGRPIPSHF